jgi:DNA-binding NarL/FixJ family response regulator
MKMKRFPEATNEKESPCENDASLTFVSPGLTSAEKRILACVSRAQTNKEIARELKISPATVKRHLENILRKLGLRNRVEAAIFGLGINRCTRTSESLCPLTQWWHGRNHPPHPQSGPFDR